MTVDGIITCIVAFFTICALVTMIYLIIFLHYVLKNSIAEHRKSDNRIKKVK